MSDSTKKKLKELTRANQATMLTETDEWELAHAGKDPGPVNLFLSYKGPKKFFDPQEQLIALSMTAAKPFSSRLK